MKINSILDINVGDYVEIRRDTGCADNAPWTSKVTSVNSHGITVDYDDSLRVYSPLMRDYLETVKTLRGNIIHIFLK